jgi:stage II sporulation protein AA (anti-sigma F factor antagonist)
MNMALDVTTMQDIIIIMIPRRLDSGNAQGVESELKKILINMPKKVVFDFSETDYIASAGLRILLVVNRDLMKAGGRVALAGLRPAVLRIFDMAGFTSIFTVVTSREEAVRKMM